MLNFIFEHLTGEKVERKLINVTPETKVTLADYKFNIGQFPMVCLNGSEVNPNKLEVVNPFIYLYLKKHNKITCPFCKQQIKLPSIIEVAEFLHGKTDEEAKEFIDKWFEENVFNHDVKISESPELVRIGVAKAINRAKL